MNNLTGEETVEAESGRPERSPANHGSDVEALGPEAESGQREGTVVEAALSLTAVSNMTINYTVTSRYAPEWFGDALREARNGPQGDRHARCREIVFSVCFAESYLFEWSYEHLLTLGNHAMTMTKIAGYFPEGSRRGIRDRWKTVLREMHQNGDISGVPAFGDTLGNEWIRLVRYRDGLVHASASRPWSSDPSQTAQPRPAGDELGALPPGWAVRTVAAWAERLHAATGTTLPVPTWLTRP